MSPTTASPPMHESHLHGLQRIHQGKVRDIYALDDRHMLIVTTDRLSAFDVVLPDPIPGKGRVLTSISNYWFGRTGHIVPNHLAGATFPLERAVADAADRALLADRAMVVKQAQGAARRGGRARLPDRFGLEGLPGNWRDLRHRAAAGLRMADKLPEPIFTPSTKAPKGHHDENMGFDEIAKVIGADLAAQVRDAAIALYQYAAAHAVARGIIIADTKFEFGLDDARRRSR